MNRPKSKQRLPKSAKKVFVGIIFDVYQWQQKMFDGTYSTFEKLIRPDTVMIIPVTVDKKIILTRQKQPGKEAFIGLAGGRVDKGESILEAAKRELLEETGCVAQTYKLFDARQPISKIEWGVYTYIALGCKRIHNQNLDKGEMIDVLEVTFEEFIDIILSKDFQDSELIQRLIELNVLEIRENNQKLEKLKKDFFS